MYLLSDFYQYKCNHRNNLDIDLTLKKYFLNSLRLKGVESFWARFFLD